MYFQFLSVNCNIFVNGTVKKCSVLMIRETGNCGCFLFVITQLIPYMSSCKLNLYISL